MDFHRLLAKMQELDQPTQPAVVEAPAVTDECGDMPSAPMGMSSPMGKPDTPPPSVSINLNAQGIDNIEDLMKLIKAVNPEMDKPEMPMMGIEPMDKPAGGLPPMGGLGNLDAGPLKMLPDLDADNDDMPGGEHDDVSMAQGDLDNDGDHDMDDHEMEKDDEEKEDESFGNSVGGSEPEVGGIDAAVHDGNDLNRPKTMTKHSYRQGDNPMAMEGEELRSYIRSELQRRLQEAKGAK